VAERIAPQGAWEAGHTESVSQVRRSPAHPEASARGLLDKAREPSRRDVRAQLSEQLAAALLQDAESYVDAKDQGRTTRLKRLMADPAGQRFSTTLTDRVFRTSDAARVAVQVKRLVERLGPPRFLSPMERLELSLAASLAHTAAPVIARGVLKQVKQESRGLVLDQATAQLEVALKGRRAEGIRINLNQLGEALLGEQDAERRVAKYAAIAQRKDVDALSVKVSSIGSWLAPLAFDADVARLAARLSTIYRASLAGKPVVPTRVMLDMEAYDDVPLTLAVLKAALAAPGCAEARAGVVLQAYLPDSHAHLESILELARMRAAQGLPPLRVRLVKGANLAFERVDSARRGLVLPMFARKVETDASFKRLLERLLQEGVGRGIELGVASHNVFDVAFALVSRASSRAPDAVGIEMLEGMAMPLLRSVVALGVEVLSYVPVCADDAMVNGIAYLVRRLDENTAPENFLRHSFGMRADDAAFLQERERFRDALRRMDNLDLSPRRAPQFATGLPSARGEADTDFARTDARTLVADAIAALHAQPMVTLESMGARPLVRGARVPGFDPSRPGAEPYAVHLLQETELDNVLAPLVRDASGFGRSTLARRSALLARAAQRLRDARAELIAAVVMDAGKRVVEADAEVSEAIDFAEYYRRSFRELVDHVDAVPSPRGVVLVAPPWNFPLAIPAGGVFAALMAGNRVVLKPACETAYVAFRLASCLWDAGIPKDVLSLVLCSDDVASRFVQDPRVATVVLTGATSTARLLQRLRPGLHLAAETGGKNAYIVSAMSDREQAIRDVVVSAFGHAGQKCSATSLLIAEAEVYDDPHFMDTLEDAVRSLRVGPAHLPETFVTPLIQPPAGPLARALSELSAGERWLVPPKVNAANPRLVGPAVKVGVTPASADYTTELFGPVLGVMRATSFDHALELARGTGYGLTAGLASLDEEEQGRFVAEARAGNLYVNRPTTGAVVERQPFGGYDASSFGSGAKAGGPNYVARLARWQAVPASTDLSSTRLPEWLVARLNALAEQLGPRDLASLALRLRGYVAADQAHFSRAHDPHAVLGQHNLFRYRPRPQLLLRVAADAEPRDVLGSVLAAELCQAAHQVSVHPAYPGTKDATLLGCPVHIETGAAMVERLRVRSYVRIVGTREPELDALCAETGAHLADDPVLEDGRLELLHYTEEQSVSIEAHRHGYLQR
jgi:RHH-type proline utilization regulon transcriptional repressor/proline dehydrogenase/delta 1-pyrroline-5-carboxylate dehydrogenase